MVEELKMPERLAHISIDSSHDVIAEPVKAEPKPKKEKVEAKPEPIKAEEAPQEPVKTEESSIPAEPPAPPAEPEPIVETLPEKSPEEKAQEEADQKSAREAIEYRMRAEAAERQLKELQPKVGVPTNEPDINDQTTWGEKYKNDPNELATFLKAHADWAMEQGKNAERAAYKQQQAEKEQMAMRVAVAQKEQESRAKHPDYDAVIAQAVPVISQVPILRDFIGRNPMGTEVAYELFQPQNAQILRSLLQSDVWTAGEQLLNMAARLKNAKPTKTVTKAPAPIKPVGSNDTAGGSDYAELAVKNTAAFIEKRNAERIKRLKMN